MPNADRWSLFAAIVFLIAAVTVTGCAKSAGSDGFSPGGASGSDGGSPLGTGPGSGSGSAPTLTLDSSVATGDDGSTCPATTCTPIGGQYCGTVGDGCGGELSCGTCAMGFTCQSGLCIGDATCVPATCTAGGATFCGSVGDNCGHALDCGTCANGDSCISGVCVAANCTRLSCGNDGNPFCGTVGDGCGGTLPCGDCPAGSVCGGGGIDHLCAPANCTKGSCTATNGAVYCGTIGDGCGGALDCGATCANGQVCGAMQPNVCPGTGSGGCSGIQCNIAMCPNSGMTTISGTVTDPAAVNPIYNALVYIPNGPLDPVPTGASCDLCNATASGSPITNALTDTTGHFTLTNVPNGTNIPLVIQVGKWRREVTIPTVTACVDNPITDPDLTRLPRTQAEGNIPHIALTTGNADALECLLRRIGIADTEFTTDTGPGRVHLYYGGDLTGPTGGGAGTNSFSAGGAFSSAATLWSSLPKLEGYDIMMLSCEGGQFADAKKPYIANPEAYLNAGGRVFYDHDHFYWLRSGSAAMQGTATYIGNGSKLPEPINGFVNTTFPKGAALSSWLVNVGATPTASQLAIYQGQHSVSAVIPPTQAWITVPMNPNDSAMRPSIQYMTFNTPVGTPADAQCGRAVFTDLHMNAAVNGAGGDNSDPTKPFPTECKTNGMTPQAKALEFMFFDLSSCVQPDTGTPTPPPPPPVVDPPPPTSSPPPPRRRRRRHRRHRRRGDWAGRRDRDGVCDGTSAPATATATALGLVAGAMYECGPMRGFLQPAVRIQLTDHQLAFRGLSRHRRTKLARAAQTDLLKADRWSRRGLRGSRGCDGAGERGHDRDEEEALNASAWGWGQSRARARARALLACLQTAEAFGYVGPTPPTTCSLLNRVIGPRPRRNVVAGAGADAVAVAGAGAHARPREPPRPPRSAPSYTTFFASVARTRSNRSRIPKSTLRTYPSASATSIHAPVSRADPSAFR